MNGDIAKANQKIELDNENTNRYSDFKDEWNKVEDTLFKFCLTMTHDNETAKELNQIIAIRAFVGFKGWKRLSSFKTWIFTIARNVANDYFKRVKENSIIFLTDHEKFEPLYRESAQHTNFDSNNETIVKELLEAILRIKWPNTKKNFLDELDLNIIRLKLNNPEVSSEKLAKYLGISSTTLDARYSRALVDIRAYCFLSRPDLFGGIAKIKVRFDKLCAHKPPSINEIERNVFESYVINRDYAFKPVGWQNALRSACGKLIFNKSNFL